MRILNNAPSRITYIHTCSLEKKVWLNGIYRGAKISGPIGVSPALRTSVSDFVASEQGITEFVTRSLIHEITDR
jgi:hypothetical protein